MSPPSAPESSFTLASRAILLRLAALPPLAVPALMLTFMLTGLLAPLPIALPALLVALAFVTWLAVLSWPVLDVRGKLVRALLVGLVAGAAVGRSLGWL